MNYKNLIAGVARDRQSPDCGIVPAADDSGCTVADPTGKICQVIVPARKSDALSRTVRIHELIHASHPETTLDCPDGVCDLARQAICDVLVHAKYWPKDWQAIEDAQQAVAEVLDGLPIADLLTTKLSAEEYNDCLCKILWGLAASCCLQAPQTVLGAAKHIIQVAKRDPEKAMHQLQSMFRGDKEPDPFGADRGPTTADPFMPSSDPYESAPDVDDDYMTIVDLVPRYTPCNPQRRDSRSASRGSRMRASRLARAIRTGDTSRLYVRRRRAPQGVILIDASGSMLATQARLNAVCQAAPGHIVAFYSGPSDVRGLLWIYAREGLRFDGDLPKQINEGNTVDYPALLWAVAQGGSITFITDLGFCGGRKGHPEAAAKLTSQLVSSGRLRVIPSIEDAIVEFGGVVPEEYDDEDSCPECGGECMECDECGCMECECECCPECRRRDCICCPQCGYRMEGECECPRCPDGELCECDVCEECEHPECNCTC